ncbi:MAG: hypothetical protein HeimC3_44400 [Candidatus Heimdallarchaeota archaeon LC_3]|nr:MAG: hypothetical protein HeimC3_44400 [Candidatus Heimdallarchaeota archaeon LC_3]
MAVSAVKAIKDSELLEALRQQSVVFRAKAIEYVPVKIHDWFQAGEPDKDGIQHQPIEVFYEGEETVTKLILKGVETIKEVLGEHKKAKNGNYKFSKVDYETDEESGKEYPVRMKGPVQPKDELGRIFFQIGKNSET